MKYSFENNYRLRAFNQNSTSTRNIDTKNIYLPPGYQIEVVAAGLDVPIDMVFSDNGDLYVADSGVTSGNPKVLHYINNRFETIADNFTLPITGISYLDGNIYVSHKNFISVLHSNGNRQSIIAGLPCNGDFGISNVAFGPEGKIYFGLGTATNSGVVGADNPWVYDHPLLHDVPASNIVLNGQNYITDNIFVHGEKASTGGFCPYGVASETYEIVRSVIKASGSILRANRDGTQIEMVAWGFRNPIRIKFDKEFRLLAANRGYDVRGSRPIANAPDEIYYVEPGVWYGWPDYSAGEPVTLPRFQPEGRHQPEFLLAEHPNIPPKPYAEFSSHSSIMGFDINYNESFGPIGDLYIAEFGSLGPLTMGPSAPYRGIGHKISKIDQNTREIITFASNKSGLPALTMEDSGFGRIVDVTFGPEGAMYVLEIGISDPNIINQYIPNSGMLWRINRINNLN
jgi:glucose/arabinose dehydrogenase